MYCNVIIDLIKVVDLLELDVNQLRTMVGTLSPPGSTPIPNSNNNNNNSIKSTTSPVGSPTRIRLLSSEKEGNDGEEGI